MAPSRFRRDRARDVTPFRDSAPAANAANAPTGPQPNRPTTPGPNSQPNRPTTPGPTNQPNRPTTPGPTSHPNRPTTPGPTNQPDSPCSESRSTTPSPVSRPLTPGVTSPVCVTPSPEKHPIWTSYDAPINFTWVIPEELCGMGWPKSRDQVRFLITQGIDHLVTLSPEKIPPVYAFPDLKHTSIPVEDFTGPTIAEIQKFIEIMDEARKDGEAVGVHCAEGRGRTGVMCACYLIYYHDMEPWDAIRIMRRQRPGSVERKIQEETVIKFWTLVQDYGKSSLDKLEEREKQLMEQQRRHQSELLRESDLMSQQMTMNLLGHMSSFYKQGPKVKAERCQRMRRAKSMTKIEDEEEKSIAQLKNHLASFFTGSGREGRQKRSKSQARDIKDSDGEAERRSRATTPGKGLIEEVKLKPVGESKPKNRLDPPPTAEEPCEYKNHFRDFMRTPAMNPRTPSTVKRGRSFSQPRDKDKDSGKEESLSRKESFEDKYVADRNEQENPLEKHSKSSTLVREGINLRPVPVAKPDCSFLIPWPGTPKPSRKTAPLPQVKITKVSPERELPKERQIPLSVAEKEDIDDLLADLQAIVKPEDTKTCNNIDITLKAKIENINGNDYKNEEILPSIDDENDINVIITKPTVKFSDLEAEKSKRKDENKPILKLAIESFIDEASDLISEELPALPKSQKCQVIKSVFEAVVTELQIVCLHEDANLMQDTVHDNLIHEFSVDMHVSESINVVSQISWFLDDQIDVMENEKEIPLLGQADIAFSVFEALEILYQVSWCHMSQPITSPELALCLANIEIELEECLGILLGESLDKFDCLDILVDIEDNVLKARDVINDDLCNQSYEQQTVVIKKHPKLQRAKKKVKPALMKKKESVIVEDSAINGEPTFSTSEEHIQLASRHVSCKEENAQRESNTVENRKEHPIDILNQNDMIKEYPEHMSNSENVVQECSVIVLTKEEVQIQEPNKEINVKESSLFVSRQDECIQEYLISSQIEQMEQIREYPEIVSCKNKRLEDCSSSASSSEKHTQECAGIISNQKEQVQVGPVPASRKKETIQEEQEPPYIKEEKRQEKPAPVSCQEKEIQEEVASASGQEEKIQEQLEPKSSHKEKIHKGPTPVSSQEEKIEEGVAPLSNRNEEIHDCLLLVVSQEEKIQENLSSASSQKGQKQKCLSILSSKEDLVKECPVFVSTPEKLKQECLEFVSSHEKIIQEDYTLALEVNEEKKIQENLIQVSSQRDKKQHNLETLSFKNVIKECPLFISNSEKQKKEYAEFEIGHKDHIEEYSQPVSRQNKQPVLNGFISEVNQADEKEKSNRTGDLENEAQPAHCVNISQELPMLEPCQVKNEEDSHLAVNIREVPEIQKNVVLSAQPEDKKEINGINDTASDYELQLFLNWDVSKDAMGILPDIKLNHDSVNPDSMIVQQKTSNKLEELMTLIKNENISVENKIISKVNINHTKENEDLIVATKKILNEDLKLEEIITISEKPVEDETLDATTNTSKENKISSNVQDTYIKANKDCIPVAQKVSHKDSELEIPLNISKEITEQIIPIHSTSVSSEKKIASKDDNSQLEDNKNLMEVAEQISSNEFEKPTHISKEVTEYIYPISKIISKVSEYIYPINKIISKVEDSYTENEDLVHVTGKLSNKDSEPENSKNLSDKIIEDRNPINKEDVSLENRISSKVKEIHVEENKCLIEVTKKLATDKLELEKSNIISKKVNEDVKLINTTNNDISFKLEDSQIQINKPLIEADTENINFSKKSIECIDPINATYVSLENEITSNAKTSQDRENEYLSKFTENISSEDLELGKPKIILRQTTKGINLINSTNDSLEYDTVSFQRIPDKNLELEKLAASKESTEYIEPINAISDSSSNELTLKLDLEKSIRMSNEFSERIQPINNATVALENKIISKVEDTNKEDNEELTEVTNKILNNESEFKNTNNISKEITEYINPNNLEDMCLKNKIISTPEERSSSENKMFLQIITKTPNKESELENSIKHITKESHSDIPLISNDELKVMQELPLAIDAPLDNAASLSNALEIALVKRDVGSDATETLQNTEHGVTQDTQELLPINMIKELQSNTVQIVKEDTSKQEYPQMNLENILPVTEVPINTSTLDAIKDDSTKHIISNRILSVQQSQKEQETNGTHGDIKNMPINIAVVTDTSRDVIQKTESNKTQTLQKDRQLDATPHYTLEVAQTVHCTVVTKNKANTPTGTDSTKKNNTSSINVLNSQHKGGSFCLPWPGTPGTVKKKFVANDKSVISETPESERRKSSGNIESPSEKTPLTKRRKSSGVLNRISNNSSFVNNGDTDSNTQPMPKTPLANRRIKSTGVLNRISDSSLGKIVSNDEVKSPLQTPLTTRKKSNGVLSRINNSTLFLNIAGKEPPTPQPPARTTKKSGGALGKMTGSTNLLTSPNDNAKPPSQTAGQHREKQPSQSGAQHDRPDNCSEVTRRHQRKETRI